MSSTTQTAVTASDGTRWALVPVGNDGVSGQRRWDDLIKYDDPKSKRTKKFKYTKLTDVKKHIRLLKLLAGTPETKEVHCLLFEADISGGNGDVLRLDGEPHNRLVKYEALSWCWGTEAPEHQILIQEGDRRRRKKASRELVWALRFLRYRDKDRVLWIDAICINQDDVDEKNHQVQMMSQIYTYAWRVCIWLGLDDRNSTMAIKFIKNEILQLAQFDDLCANEGNSEKWQSLLLLMQRPWFFRRWVVQEIALAKDARIYCGEDEIDWKDFSVAVELFVEVETATHRLSEVMKKDPRYYHIPGWFEYVSALGASLLVEATGMVFRYYKPEKKVQIKAAIGESTAANSTVIGNHSDAQVNGFNPEAESKEEDSSEGESDASEMYNYSRDKEDQESDSESDDEIEPATGTENSDLVNKETGSYQLPDLPTEYAKSTGPTDPIALQRPLLSLEYLVSKLSVFEASEPRDAIYAMLAIANDAYPAADGDGGDVTSRTKEFLSNLLSYDRKPFPVDYGRSYSDVCRVFVEFCIGRSDPTRALDILCRPWAPAGRAGPSKYFTPKPQSERIKAYLKKLQAYHSDPTRNPHSKGWSEILRWLPEDKRDKSFKLPSWIPRLKGAPFGMFPSPGVPIMKMGRKNADPLVGHPGGSRSYDAAQGTDVDLDNLSFKKRYSQRVHCMFVKGFILERIEKTADASQTGNIPGKWLRLANWNLEDNPNNDKGPPEEFWRTIVADRGNDGRNPPHYYSRACKESVYKGGVVGGSVNTSDLINNERNSIVAEFCRRVQAVIWNKKIFQTNKGNLGIASKSVRKGDFVCILYGCSVPVILRRRMKPCELVQQEREEDKVFTKVERTLLAYMSRAKGIRERRERWNQLPEKKTGDFKYGKEDVRKWREECIAKLKEEERSKSEPESRPSAEPKRRDDCWYKFLGECYVHGMMDGEAVKRKIEYEIVAATTWDDERSKFLAAEKIKFYERSRKSDAIPSGFSQQPQDMETQSNGAEGNGQEPLETPVKSDADGWKTREEELTTEFDKLKDGWRGETLIDTVFELR